MFTVIDTFQPGAINSTLPALDVEIAFTTPPTEGPVFRTVAGDLRNVGGLHTKRGRPNELGHFDTGSFSYTLDNRARNYDPNNTASPFNGNILPDRRTRGLAYWAGTCYVLSDGYIDGWPLHYDVPNDATVDIVSHDGFKALAHADIPASMYQMVVAQDNPTHWWRLNEPVGSSTAQDLGVAGANPAPGTYSTAGVTLASTSPVTYDGGAAAALFNGTTGKMTVLPNALLGNTVFTLEVWFSTVSSNGGTIVGAGGNSATGLAATLFPRCVIVEVGSGAIYGEYTDGTTDAKIQTGGTYNDGVGHHAVIVSNGTQIEFFVDGVSIGTASTPAAAVNGAALAFACSLIQSPNGDHTIAECAVYEGVTLTAAQVLDHYNAGKNALLAEATGTRVGRILNYIGVPASSRMVSTGNSTLGSYELPGGQALNYLTTLTDTEQNQFYMGLDGAMSTKSTFDVVWRNRQAPITASRSNTSQATFGDAAGELEYVDILFDYGDSKIFNDVAATRSGGNTQRVSDVTSSPTSSGHNYFRQTQSITGLWQTDNDAFDIANWYLAHYKDPHSRIVGLVIKPQSDPTHLWPQVLGREIGDRVTVKRRPPGGGAAISQDLIIEGVQHDFDGELWITTWVLNVADTQAYWVLGDSVFSVLDTTTRLAA